LCATLNNPDIETNLPDMATNTDTYQAAARNQNLTAGSGPMEKDFENGIRSEFASSTQG
jgi:hypothetical protein